MRLQVQIRMSEDSVFKLRKWAKEKKKDDVFSLNTWLVGIVNDGMRKEGIL